MPSSHGEPVRLDPYLPQVEDRFCGITHKNKNKESYRCAQQR